MTDVFRYKNRVLGEYNKAKHVFITHRNMKKHLYRLYNGFGFNEGAVKQLIRIGCWNVWVFVEEDGLITLYKTSPEKIMEHGRLIKNSKDVRDLQLVLPIEYFQKH